MPIPSLTTSPESASAAGSAPAAEPAPPSAETAQPSKISRPSREIFSDPEDPYNIIKGYRTQKPILKPNDLFTIVFL